MTINKVYGWIEVIVVTLFSWWILANTFYFSINYWNRGMTDTGGEVAALLIGIAFVLVPAGMILRLMSRFKNIPDEDPTTTSFALLSLSGLIIAVSLGSMFLWQIPENKPWGDPGDIMLAFSYVAIVVCVAVLIIYGFSNYRQERRRYKLYMRYNQNPSQTF